MILFEDALARTLAETVSVETEQVSLEDALGRFLGAPISSPMDAPPFDKAAMDGYAIRPDDDRSEYRLREVVAAGDVPNLNALEPGEAVKIMTGAPLPAGAGKVVRVEFTSLDGETVNVTEPELYLNIIRQGENIRAGDPLLEPGRLGPKEIGCLAAAGIGEVELFRQLRVGVITTGDELRTAGASLNPGEIYDSNGPQLIAQIRHAGGLAVPYGIVPDDRAAHRSAVLRGLDECDFLLLTGGVSKGDYDYVPDVLAEAGVDIKYHGVRIKPGRPTLFGRTAETLVFGLPGNPVSTFVVFEVLVRPLIHRVQGAPSPGVHVRARLAAAITRKDVERAEFYPATLGVDVGGPTLTPLRYGGSSHLNALALANALVSIPAGTEHLAAGDQVDARLI